MGRRTVRTIIRMADGGWRVETSKRSSFWDAFWVVFGVGLMFSGIAAWPWMAIPVVLLFGLLVWAKYAENRRR